MPIIDLMRVTDVGDSAVLSGVVVIGALYLFAVGCRKGSAALLIAFVFAGTVTGLAKLAFLGCDILDNHYGIASPSGHSALSFAVLGAYALIISTQLKKSLRFIPFLLCIPLALTVAMTRVLLGFHSIEEVAAGLFIGMLAFAVCLWFLRGEALPRFNIYGFLFAMLAVAVLLYGLHLPAEGFIHRLAAYIKRHVAMCSGAVIP